MFGADSHESHVAWLSVTMRIIIIGKVELVFSSQHICPQNITHTVWACTVMSVIVPKAQKSYTHEDYDGSRRLGRKALHLGIASFVIGAVIITAYIIIHFTTVWMHQI